MAIPLSAITHALDWNEVEYAFHTLPRVLRGFLRDPQLQKSPKAVSLHSLHFLCNQWDSWGFAHFALAEERHHSLHTARGPFFTFFAALGSHRATPTASGSHLAVTQDAHSTLVLPAPAM